MSSFNINKNMPYWRNTEKTPDYPSLSGLATNYDVVIIGGGITGLTAGYLLKKSGKKVAVLERYRLGCGTTGFTTAHLQSMPDEHYDKLEKSFGSDGAKLTYNALIEAINLIEKTVQTLNIDCDFSRIPGYLYTEKESDVSELQKTFEATQRVGQQCYLIDTVPELPFKTVKAIQCTDQGQFHIMKYIYALARAVDGEGSNVFENTRVMNYSDGEPCVVETKKGNVECKAIIVATHTPIGIHILHTAVAPYRSYVMGVTINGEYPNALYWDTEDPYHYTRSAVYYPPASGAAAGIATGERILIVGGKDHKTAHAVGDEHKHFEQLEDYIRKHFSVKEIIYKWSAQLYNSCDGLPYIGRSHMKKNVYLATGYFGDGMTWGTIGAKIIHDLIVGLESPYAKLVDPARFTPLASAKEFISENIDVGIQYAAGWLRSDGVKSEDLKPGEAAVVQHGKHKVAMYRDELGIMHKCSAVCAHLKAIVKWNPEEKTWDCPAHGGRYDMDGHILEGPPIHDLEDLIDVKDVL